MSWIFQAMDRYGTPLGELTDTVQRRTRVPINGLTTGTFVISTSHSLANRCRQGDLTLIKAYRNGTLMGVGPLAPNYNKVVNETTQTLSCNWTSVGWRLSRRIIESSKSKAGVTYGSPTSLIDAGLIVQTFLNELNAVSDTGIRVGTIGSSTTTFVGPWQYKNALQAIQDLSAPLGGFDYRFVHNEPTSDALGLALASFTCAAVLGSLKVEAIFEYGDGRRNVASFTETGDISGLMNRGYILPAGFPDNVLQDAIAFQDDQSIQLRGLNEDVVTSDLASTDLLTKLIQDHVTVRKVPRMVITFQPTVDPRTGVMPQYGTDYQEGDMCQFRAVENTLETVNAIFRIYVVDFEIDDEGNETATPTLLAQ